MHVPVHARYTSARAQGREGLREAVDFLLLFLDRVAEELELVFCHAVELGGVDGWRRGGGEGVVAVFYGVGAGYLAESVVALMVGEWRLAICVLEVAKNFGEFHTSTWGEGSVGSVVGVDHGHDVSFWDLVFGVGFTMWSDLRALGGAGGVCRREEFLN